jgi:hypothetical protein
MTVTSVLKVQWADSLLNLSAQPYGSLPVFPVYYLAGDCWLSAYPLGYPLDIHDDIPKAILLRKYGNTILR